MRFRLRVSGSEFHVPGFGCGWHVPMFSRAAAMVVHTASTMVMFLFVDQRVFHKRKNTRRNAEVCNVEIHE